MYVWMDGCRYVCMYVWMDGCLYICMYGWMEGWMDVTKIVTVQRVYQKQLQ